MSWPDAVEDCWPDDHTAEARALYEQVRREALVPVPEPLMRWMWDGPTAEARRVGVSDQYLAPAREPRQRRPRAA